MLEKLIIKAFSVAMPATTWPPRANPDQTNWIELESKAQPIQKAGIQQKKCMGEKMRNKKWIVNWKQKCKRCPTTQNHSKNLMMMLMMEDDDNDEQWCTVWFWGLPLNQIVAHNCLPGNTERITPKHSN